MRIFLVSLLLFSAGLLSAQEDASTNPHLLFSPGQRLDAIVQEYYAQAYYRPAGSAFTPPAEQLWDGMDFVVASPRPGLTDAPQIIGLSLHDRPPVPIGIRQIVQQAPGYEYLMDIDGDAVLDIAFSKPLVPFFALYPQGGNPAGWQRDVLLLLDYQMEAIQSPDNPFLTGGSRDELLVELSTAAHNQDVLNRDIRYHLYFCLLHANEPEFEFAVYYAWMYLGSMISDRFGLHHPLPAVYALYISWELGRTVETREWLHFLQRVRRGLIPAQIFDTLTTDSERIREQKRRWVQYRNPDHWWVKQALEE